MRRFRSLAAEEGGATSAEYAIVVTLIAGAILFAVGPLGRSLVHVFARAASSIDPSPSVWMGPSDASRGPVDVRRPR